MNILEYAKMRNEHFRKYNSIKMGVLKSAIVEKMIGVGGNPEENATYLVDESGNYLTDENGNLLTI